MAHLRTTLIWGLANLGVLAALHGALMLVVAVILWFVEANRGSPERTLATYLIEGLVSSVVLVGALGLGLVAYLALLSLVAGQLAERRQRLAAIALSPVVTIVVVLGLRETLGWSGLVFYAALVPILYGSLVRLPPRSVSERSDDAAGA